MKNDGQAESNQPLQKILISQKDNYSANFGEVLRSSAQFWAIHNPSVSTTISFCNYWKFKNSNDVLALINLRQLDGRLTQRIPVKFNDADVVNYTPPMGFEGSVEVEVFSIKNLRIPYAAIMAVYECDQSISMLHSYARAYSQHEIEEHRTLCDGAESCWTLRDSTELTSFCVFHNGSAATNAQTVKLGIRNSGGKEKVIYFELPSLLPFQTIVIEPKNYFSDIVEWLAGEPGNGRLSFKLNGGFTRMLCGIKNRSNRQMQVTHSNFDYSTHDTDVIGDGSSVAYMRTPTVRAGVTEEIVVYPDNYRGNYFISDDNEQRAFSTGEIIQKKFPDNQGRLFAFSREDHVFPTRLVTAFRLNTSPSTIPAECSLGVVHHQTPKKHFSWMIVSEQFNSSICWVDYKELHAGCPADAQLALNLYSELEKIPLTKKMIYRDLPASGTVRLNDIFGTHFLGTGFGYLTIWCSYGGLTFFSTLEKGDSISIEHSF